MKKTFLVPSLTEKEKTILLIRQAVLFAKMYLPKIKRKPENFVSYSGTTIEEYEILFDRLENCVCSMLETDDNDLTTAQVVAVLLNIGLGKPLYTCLAWYGQHGATYAKVANKIAEAVKTEEKIGI